MLNYIWAFMILVGIVIGICNGKIEEVGNSALESAGNAVTLCITMLGIMAMWTGLMQIARASGLLERMTKGMRPIIRFLFPKIPKESKAGEYIATNMIANILGLGWAATPAGLQAMEALKELEEERRLEDASSKSKNESKTARSNKTNITNKTNKTNKKSKVAHAVAPGVASNEMCIFLIMNISSLQLIPVNMIAYRSQYGSASPTSIIAPAIVATLISTLVAVVYCKVMDKKKGK